MPRALLPQLGHTSSGAPFSHSHALQAPIFVCALSPLVLHEPVSRSVLWALPLSITGVVLVSQPTALFGGTSQINPVGVALGLLKAVIAGSVKLTIRSLSSTESVASIVFSVSAIRCWG